MTRNQSITVRLEPQLKATLTRIAKRADMSMSDAVRHLLREGAMARGYPVGLWFPHLSAANEEIGDQK